MLHMLASVTYRGLTADHYKQDNKYFIHYYKPNEPWKTLAIMQVRGLTEPLTEEDLKHHIDCRWNDYYREKGEFNKDGIVQRQKMREAQDTRKRKQ